MIDLHKEANMPPTVRVTDVIANVALKSVINNTDRSEWEWEWECGFIT